jgi:hypothetical protein
VNAATRELIRLYNRDGKLTQEQVVAEATDPSSPLHRHFEWDDQSAAHRWRLDQAEILIRSAEVWITIEEHKVKVRAIPHVTGSGYVPLDEALARKPLRDQLMADLQRDIDRMVSRYERYRFAAGVVSDLKKWRRALGEEA